MTRFQDMGERLDGWCERTGGRLRRFWRHRVLRQPVPSPKPLPPWERAMLDRVIATYSQRNAMLDDLPFAPPATPRSIPIRIVTPDMVDRIRTAQTSPHP